ncbi:MAG: hypothetical protein KUG77_14685 [Nannocystaceae bacterium]|nr:hypothetical protein [Nannocystaceae bacterium]
MARVGWMMVCLAVAACGDDAPPMESGGTSGSTAAATTTVASSSTSTSDADGSESSGGPTVPEPDPEVDWPTVTCDALDPNYCAFPFPSNVHTIAAPQTPTGRRVKIDPEGWLVTTSGLQVDLSVLERSDGFSTSAAMMVHMPGASVTGLPSPLDIGSSLQPESPTVLLDAQTGERVPHFSELDMSHGQADKRVLFVRPAVRLEEGTRYIVAIRNVLDAEGDPLTPSPAFEVLRDLRPTQDEGLEARRPLYADIFGRLAEAGVERGSLQLAWDFTTASRENITGSMLEIRDDALEVIGAGGPGFEIERVEDDYSDNIMRRVTGTISVPLYLETEATGTGFNWGQDGMPVQNGFADFDFEVLIPYAAMEAPAPILHVGHGLLGSLEEVGSGHYQRLANQHNFVLVATDWAGMATPDLLNVAGFLSTGEIHRFHTVADRLQQGVLNAIVFSRALQGDLGADVALDLGDHSAVDPSRVFYAGSSQGGIMGSVLLAVSPDIQRGILDVPGQPYNLLLNRSVDFENYLGLLWQNYDNPIDIQFGLSLIQMMWDRSEPAGYTHLIRDGLLPGSPPKDVLLQVAIGDHQVSTLGAHIMARAAGVPNLGPVNREIWGLETAEGTVEGSAMIEYEFGVVEPIVNIPTEDGEDPHGKLRNLEQSIETRAQFLLEGTIETHCDGPCDPE